MPKDAINVAIGGKADIVSEKANIRKISAFDPKADLGCGPKAVEERPRKPKSRAKLLDLVST